MASLSIWAQHTGKSFPCAHSLASGELLRGCVKLTCPWARERSQLSSCRLPAMSMRTDGPPNSSPSEDQPSLGPLGAVRRTEQKALEGFPKGPQQGRQRAVCYLYKPTGHSYHPGHAGLLSRISEITPRKRKTCHLCNGPTAYSPTGKVSGTRTSSNCSMSQ